MQDYCYCIVDYVHSVSFKYFTSNLLGLLPREMTGSAVLVLEKNNMERARSGVLF